MKAKRLFQVYKVSHCHDYPYLLLDSWHRTKKRALAEAEKLVSAHGWRTCYVWPATDHRFSRYLAPPNEAIVVWSHGGEVFRGSAGDI